jgi:hypothetical protein
MTFEECHRTLVSIRRKQGTRYPLIRVDYAGSTVLGRLTRADSDPEHGRPSQSPYGVLVLENPGLGRGPQTVLQIANINEGGILDVGEN